jgi:hypothetical protein
MIHSSKMRQRDGTKLRNLSENPFKNHPSFQDVALWLLGYGRSLELDIL